MDQRPPSSNTQLDYNAPLLSTRRAGGAPSLPPKPFYKLSAELSRESLRIPGAVPFIWEQTPGLPKNKNNDDTSSILALPPGRPSPSHHAAAAAAALERGISSAAAVDRANGDARLRNQQNCAEHIPPKSVDTPGRIREARCSSGRFEHKSLASLFRQGSKSERSKVPKPGKDIAAPASRPNQPMTSTRHRPPASPVVVVEASPSARYSLQPDLGNEDAFSEAADTIATTEAVTTTCRLSVDESYVDGSQFISHTGSEARDFIMHRFLPAAHAIACDSPQTPSRRPTHGTPSPVTSVRLLARGPLPLTPRRPPVKQIIVPVEDDDERHGVSVTACGFFSFRFRNIFMHSKNSRSKLSNKTQYSPSPLSSRSAKLVDMLHEDTSVTDDEDAVVQQVVRANMQEKRAHMMEHNRPSPRHMAAIKGSPAAMKGSPLHQLLAVAQETQTPNNRSVTYYDASSRLSPNACVTPYRNGAPMSPFPEGRKFLGLPKDRHPDGITQGDGTSSCFETPRASMGDTKPVEIDGCSNNGYRSSSPLSRGQKPASPSQRVGKVLVVGMIGPNNTSLAEKAAELADNSCSSPNVKQPEPSATVGYKGDMLNGALPALQQPNGCTDTMSSEVPMPEKKGWPLLISGRRANSPSRFIGPKKWVETESPLNVLSPPLPKSPSESWLWRAIPLSATSLSPLASSQKVPILAVKKPLDFPSNDPDPLEDAKWEAIVKGSHVQPGHLRFSKELVHESTNSIQVGVP